MLVIAGQPPGKAGRRWGKKTPIRKTLSVYFFAKKQVEKSKMLWYTEINMENEEKSIICF